eukprot:9658265-Alexandrium_andersonii.AAC.1
MPSMPPCSLQPRSGSRAPPLGSSRSPSRSRPPCCRKMDRGTCHRSRSGDRGFSKTFPSLPSPGSG